MAGGGSTQTVLNSGDEITASITVPGGFADYIIVGTVGQHITLDISASGWGAGTAKLSLLNPSGGVFNSFTLSGSSTFSEYNLNAAGNWKLVIDPDGNAIGSATLKYGADIDGGTLASEGTVNAEIGIRGQNATYKFSGSNGMHITFDVPASSWGSGSASINVYRPDGSLLNYFNLANSATWGDFTLNATGNFTMVLNPAGGSLGSATFKFAVDIDLGNVSSGSSVSSSIGIKGQNASFTFDSTNGAHITLDVPTNSWGVSGSATLSLYRPDGSLHNYINLNGTANFGDFTLNVTGKWKVLLNPGGGSTGSATITYSEDIVGGNLVSGQPVTTAIGISGQNAAYTFAGATGQHITFDVTASSWSTSSGATIVVYRPNGTVLNYCNLANSPAYCDLILDATGTWTMYLNPNGFSTGTATFVFAYDIDGGGLTSDTSVTTTIGLKGQNAAYTFAGTAGQHITFDLTASTWSASSGATLYVYRPNGTVLNYCNLVNSPTYCDFVLDATGTWTMYLNPNGFSTGTATFVFAYDIDGGALTSGTPVTTTIGTKGQNAGYSFTLSAGRTVHIDVPSTGWGGGSAVLRVYRPDGTQFNYINLGSSPTSWDPNFATAGTWRIVVDPSGGATGAVSFSIT